MACFSTSGVWYYSFPTGLWCGAVCWGNTENQRSWFSSSSSCPQCAVFTLREMEIKLHRIEPQNPATPRSPRPQYALCLAASYYQEKGATVGDSDTPDHVLHLCLLRLLLIQPLQPPLRQIKGLHLPYYSGDVYGLRVLRFPLRRQIQYPFSFTVISDLFLNLSYKLFHIAHQFQMNSPAGFPLFCLFPLGIILRLDYKAN